jgi:serine/threonine protein phosphatase PrpC
MRNKSSLGIGKELFHGERNKCLAWVKDFNSLSGNKITLAVVCQSITMVGGSPETVNQLAIDTINDQFVQYINEDRIDDNSLKSFLHKVINKVHNNILGAFEAGIVQREGEMISLTCVVILNNLAILADIGSNRAYHLQENEICQITNDHTMFTREGSFSPLTKYNILLKALGEEKMEGEANYIVRSLKHGDELIICNFEIWSRFNDRNFINHLKVNLDPNDKAKKIIEYTKGTYGSPFSRKEALNSDCATIVIKVMNE